MSRRQWNGNRSAAQQLPGPLGFTLLELILVLVILASLTAIAWPRLRPVLDRSRQREAALELKAELADAREQAIRTGQVWECWIQPGTNRYEIRPEPTTAPGIVPPDDPIQPAIGPDTPSPAAPGTSPANRAEPVASPRELAGEVVFRPLAPDPTRLSAPTEEDEQELPQMDEDDHIDSAELSFVDARWIMAVRFFPEGRASEAQIDLVDPSRGESIAVHVRGLTGGVRIEPVRRASEATDPTDHDPQTSPSDSPSVSHAQTQP